MAVTDGNEGRGSVEGDEGLTPNQAARRRRVLEAGMALASEGGYDAVQMRDVAARAQVALGTIYRYFSSKDQLLAAALVEWAADLKDRLVQRPPKGDTPAEQVLDVLTRASKAMERNPRLSAALVTAIAGPDPAVLECQRDVTQIMIDLMAGPLGGLDAEVRDGVVRVLAHVWFSSLLGWVNGWTAAGRVHEELAVAIRLLLEGR